MKSQIPSNQSNCYSPIKPVTENSWSIKNRNRNDSVDSNTPAHSINKTIEGMTHRRPSIPNIPFYLDPTSRPKAKPIRSPVPGNKESLQSSKSSHGADISPEINLDFMENSPFQEGVISESFQRPDKTFFEECHELQNLINSSNLVQIFLPKQTDIDNVKILF